MSETLPNFNCSVKKMKKISDEWIRFFSWEKRVRSGWRL